MRSLAVALGVSVVIAVGALGEAARATGVRGDDDLRDVVIDTKGKEIRGRVIERYGEGPILVLQGNSTREIDHKDVASITTVRDHLRLFMNARKEGLSVEEDARLIDRALELELPLMARVQAYHVLARDAGNERANELLGHKKVGKEWRWMLDGKPLPKEEFDERTKEWKDRFKLESEHYVVETNAGTNKVTTVRRAVDMAFDLERAYLEWMDTFGQELRAAEFVREPQRKMTFYVYSSQADENYRDALTEEREPYYNASTNTTTPEGNPNVAFTYYRLNDNPFPVDFFDVATQQLMYSTLVLGHIKGGLPTENDSRHAHWVELGMGYWFGRQFDGKPGYVARVEFQPDPEVARRAKERAQGGPLSEGRNEVTALLSMDMGPFHATGEQSKVFQAKARSLFVFLMTQNPEARVNNKVRGHGRDALLHYLRAVYIDPRSHSTDAFDEGLGDTKAEVLEKPWREWLEEQ